MSRTGKVAGVRANEETVVLDFASTRMEEAGITVSGQ